MKPGRNAALVGALLLALVLLPTASAWAQFTVTFPNGLTGSFASAEGFQTQAGASEMPGDHLKMPGIAKLGHISLYNGVFNNSQEAWRLIDQIQMNTVARGTIVVSNGSTNWVLKNAWPIEVGDTVPDGGAVRVQVLQIAYDGVVVQQQ